MWRTPSRAQKAEHEAKAAGMSVVSDGLQASQLVNRKALACVLSLGEEEEAAER